MQDRTRQNREYQESVIQIKRVSKKTKGGNQISFTALVVVGDGKGKVGVALGKAKDVASAIRKGMKLAKKKMIKIFLRGTTIPYSVECKKKAARVLLKPARGGSGLIAGGPVRVIASAAGIKDLVAKILGSRNKANNVWVTYEALKKLEVKGKKE